VAPPDWNQGSSENATIRAKLSADAMSRAVSSMMLRSYRFGRPFPNASIAFWMPVSLYWLSVENHERE
jgi:hypothetical protein